MKLYILLTVGLFISGCLASRPHLHDSGSYTVKSRDGMATQFVEVPGTYTIISDTLKAGDVIPIIVVHQDSKKPQPGIAGSR